ncbi:MAG: hypothetical protein KAS98_04005, partial [Deltaproteobacteria bacterium]|nr:hypothetical protein [Deltaproteobacteria bacterium]
PDWRIISQVAEHLGAPFHFKSEKDITEEIIKSVPLYSKVSLSEIEKGHFSYTLPVTLSKEGKSFFVPENVSEMPRTNKKYPYTLMLGSILFQLGCGYQTKHSPRLNRIIKDEYVEINPEDASKEGIQDSDVIKLISSAGEKRIKAHLANKVPKGVLFMPLPFTQGSTLVPFSKEGSGLKTCQVKIERTAT